jgi:hypothetical protein
VPRFDAEARRRSYVAAKRVGVFCVAISSLPFIGADLAMTAARATRLARVPPTLQSRVMIALGSPPGLA